MGAGVLLRGGGFDVESAESTPRLTAALLGVALLSFVAGAALVAA